MTVCMDHTFFKEGDHSVTVTSDSYVEMLWNFLEPKLRDFGSLDMWFQQDRATAHIARRSMEALRDYISRTFDFLT